MPEVLWVLGILLLVCGAAAVELVPWPALVEGGNGVMLNAAALGIPAELVYYGLLGLLLGYNGLRPGGWYWRPFEHHHLLSPGQRWLVLPFFYVGAISFLGIVFGIVIVVLGMIAAVVQHG